MIFVEIEAAQCKNVTKHTLRGHRQNFLILCLVLHIVTADFQTVK